MRTKMSRILMLLLAIVLIAGCSENIQNPVVSPDKDTGLLPSPLWLKAYVSNINPPILTIIVFLPSECDYVLGVKNATGYVIKEYLGHGVGPISIDWDMKSESGDLIHTGFYIIQVEAFLVARTTVYIEIG